MYQYYKVTQPKGCKRCEHCKSYWSWQIVL